MALGLVNWHAWTVTIAIEGAAGSALLAGRRLPAALTLTGASVLLGALWSAQQDHPLTGYRDPRVWVAAGITALVVSALALAHTVRAEILDGRRADRADEAEQERADEEARRAHELALQAAADQRAQDALDAQERAQRAEHARTMERQRAEQYAQQDTMRAQLALEQARQATEEARQRTEEARAQQAQARADSAPNASRARPGAPDDITTRRARAEWARREGTDQPMTGRELGALLGMHEGAARKVAARWRSEAASDRPEGVRVDA